jgi:ABC-type multidrug transport system fused ATPase/permease subunit
MIKLLKSINKFFLNKTQRKNIAYFFLYSLTIPFLEIISISALSGLVLSFVDFESSIKIIPNITLQEKLLAFDRIMLLKTLAFLVFFTILLKNIIIYLYYYFEKKISHELMVSNSTFMFKKHMSYPYSVHLNLNSEKVQNDILSQSKNITTYIFSLIGLLKDLIISSFLIGALLFANFQITVIVILFSISVGIIFQKITASKLNKYGNLLRFLIGSQIKIVQAVSNGIKSIILFTKKNFFNKQFNEYANKIANIQISYEMIQKIPRLLLETMFIFLIVIFIFFSIKNLEDIKNFLPYLIFLTVSSVRLIATFSNITVIAASLRFLSPVIKTIINNFDPDKTKDNHLTKVEKSHCMIDDKNFILKNIIIKDLDFKYQTNSNYILKTINLKFEKNKIYCFVGETGCGKSTLMDIIMGLLSPTSGKIFINDNIELMHNDESWFEQISYVPQETFLINETFKNNICFAENDDEISNENFSKAINLSCLDDVNLELNKNGDFNIGDRGIKISGGQRQRVGIARALYKEKPFLGLDEATSALDINTESQILKNLHNIKKNKILIIVAHRKSVIKNSDEVILLKNGIVEFVGTPDNYFKKDEALID